MSGGLPPTAPGYGTLRNDSEASVTSPTVVAPPPSRKTRSPDEMPRTAAERWTSSCVSLTLSSDASVVF